MCLYIFLNKLFIPSLLLLCTSARVYAKLNHTIEDEFNYQFGNLSDYRYWMDARVWNVDEESPLLKTFCATAHRQAGKGTCTVDWVIVKERILQFKNPKYLERGIDVVEYSLAVEEDATQKMDMIEFHNYKLAGELWAITEGRQRDCVYYLERIDNGTGNKAYNLQEEVCGINNQPTPNSLFL